MLPPSCCADRSKICTRCSGAPVSWRSTLMNVTGKQAWAIMAAGILAYEMSCDEKELLSVVVDGWLVTHPIVTRAAIAAVSLHLLNLLGPFDPLAATFFATRWAKEWYAKRFA